MTRISGFGLRKWGFSLHELNALANSASKALGKRHINAVNNSTISYVTEPRHWSEIPGPRVYPIIKHLFYLIGRKDFDHKKVNVVFENMAKEFGPIYCLHPVIIPPMVILSNPDDFETLFRATVENPIRFAFLALKEVRLRDPMFGKKGGILTENHEEWKRVRSKVSTPMLRPKTIVKYLSKMDHVTLQFMERIAELAKKNENGEMPPDFQYELYKWALESVGIVALDRRLGCLDKNLPPDSSQEALIKAVNNIFLTMSELEGSLHIWRIFPTQKFKRLAEGHRLLCSIADDAIKETEKSLQEKASRGDEAELTLMQTLLNTEGLDRRDVMTMITDMLFAGIDTTSHSIGFTLYLLAKNPQVQQKLFEEVNRVLGRSTESINEKQLAELSYLKCCVKESMRLFPIALGASRLLEKDVVFSGYKVPKGWIGICMNFVTCRDEKYFTRASEYLPERWGRDKPLGSIHPFASIPFSHGPRMCIGRRIAEQEMYIFLARVVQRFSIDYKYKEMGFDTRIVTVPSQPLQFEFRERN